MKLTPGIKTARPPVRQIDGHDHIALRTSVEISTGEV